MCLEKEFNFEIGKCLIKFPLDGSYGFTILYANFFFHPNELSYLCEWNLILIRWRLLKFENINFHIAIKILPAIRG